MAIFGELTYLLFYGESVFVRLFMVSAVCLGFFIHLLLDEIYSVEWDGKPHLKKSVRHGDEIRRHWLVAQLRLLCQTRGC